MEGSGGHLEVTENGHGPELQLVGEFDLLNVDVLRDCLAGWMLQGRREAVIDLSRTTFIDSSAIGALVAAQLAGMVLTVRGANRKVSRTLETAGVGEFLKIEG